MPLTLLLELLTHFSKNSRPLSKMSIGTRLLPKMDAQWVFAVILIYTISPTATEADFDAVRQKLQTFEELCRTNQTLAKSLAMPASVSYFCLRYKDTTRALETNLPSIELLHQARLFHQAAMGALEYTGVEANPRRYAEFMWRVGETWKFEGGISKDPTAYQSALQEFQATEEMLHESRGLQEPTADDMLQKLIAKQQVVGQYDAICIFREIFQCCWLGATYARNETQQSSFFQ